MPGLDYSIIGYRRRYNAIGDVQSDFPGFTPAWFPTSIMPIPVPWPFATDMWGVSYPAGTIGISTQIGVPATPQPTLQGGWVQYWTEGGQYIQNSNLADLSTPILSAVPDTLPSGYTARMKDDWSYDSLGGLTGYRLPTAAGWDLITWLPGRFAYGVAGLSLSTSLFLGGNREEQTGNKRADAYDIGTGNRKVQYQLTWTNDHAPPESFAGSIVVRLSHNADGSAPAVNTDGGTIDHTHSLALVDFTFTGGGGIGSDYTSAWIDAGQILPTLGTVTTFQASMDFSGITHPSLTSFSGVLMSLRLSPRVDVPWPFTCSNKPDVICIGGTVI